MKNILSNALHMGKKFIKFQNNFRKYTYDLTKSWEKGS